jgi:hypothetical protein
MTMGDPRTLEMGSARVRWRRGAPTVGLGGVLAPIGSLLLLLVMILPAFARDFSSRYCACGAKLGPHFTSAFEGLDPMARGPVLEMRLAGSRLEIRVDSTEVESPDKLIEHLLMLRESRALTHPDSPRSEVDLLAALDAKLRPETLAPYLVELERQGHTRLILLTHHHGYYTGTRVTLASRAPSAVRLAHWTSVEELVARVAERKRDLQPAFISSW